MSRDLQAIFRDLAEIDADLGQIAKGAEPESEMSILARSIHNLVDIVREMAERTR